MLPMDVTLDANNEVCPILKCRKFCSDKECFEELLSFDALHSFVAHFRQDSIVSVPNYWEQALSLPLFGIPRLLARRGFTNNYAAIADGSEYLRRPQ